MNTRHGVNAEEISYWQNVLLQTSQTHKPPDKHILKQLFFWDMAMLIMKMFIFVSHGLGLDGVIGKF